MNDELCTRVIQKVLRKMFASQGGPVPRGSHLHVVLRESLKDIHWLKKMKKVVATT